MYSTISIISFFERFSWLLMFVSLQAAHSARTKCTRQRRVLGSLAAVDKRLHSWSSTIDQTHTHTHNALPLVKPSCLQDYVADEQSVNDAEVYRTHSMWNPLMKTWGFWHSLCSSWKDGIEVVESTMNWLRSLLISWSVCCFAAELHAGTTQRTMLVQWSTQLASLDHWRHPSEIAAQDTGDRKIIHIERCR